MTGKKTAHGLLKSSEELLQEPFSPVQKSADFEDDVIICWCERIYLYGT